MDTTTAIVSGDAVVTPPAAVAGRAAIAVMVSGVTLAPAVAVADGRETVAAMVSGSAIPTSGVAAKGSVATATISAGVAVAAVPPDLEAVGSALEPLTFHDLRHTHVALLIKYGWQEYQIVRRLGWSDSKMLHAVYGHLFPNHDAELVADLEDRRRFALESSNVVELHPRQGGEK